jgi:AcrR family transcriptional regulator
MPPPSKLPSVTPRKRPVQARSRNTVQAILEAASQVLMTHGYDGTTTGLVAERAGVSIGTLYQYFPNKDSLVAELVERHVGEVLSLIEGAVLAHRAAPLDVALAAIVRASLDAHRIAPALHKVLIEQIPRKEDFIAGPSISNRLASLLHADLARRLPHLSASRLRLVAFVLETTIEALTHRAVIESPDWLDSGELEEEARTLLLPYLGTRPVS